MAYLLSLIVNGVTRLQNDTHGTNIYADKHIKNNSNDNYILLGGGGHIDKGTFALANHGVHWEGFTKRATSSATWGTLISSNGYTPLFWLDSTSGGGVAFSDKGGQTFMQIDGEYYANEGKHLVLNTGNYSTTLDGRYYTETEVNNLLAKYLPLVGGTLTGPLEIKSTSSGNYNEGLRISAAANNWAGITFGSTGLSGAPTDGWFAALNPSDQFIISPNDSSSATGLTLNAGGDAKWRNNIIIHADNHMSYHEDKTLTSTSTLSYSSSPNGLKFYNHYSGHSLGSYRGVLVAKFGNVGLEFNTYWCVNPTDAGSANSLSFRVKRDSATDWGPYSLLLTNHNYTSYTYSKTDADNRFVNITGDSMTGGLSIDAAEKGAPLILSGGKSGYTEGLRIIPSSASQGIWSTILLGGSDVTKASGTSSKSWFIGNHDGKLYINKNASDTNTTDILCNVNSNWGVGTNDPLHKLHVARDVIYVTGTRLTTSGGAPVGMTYSSGKRGTQVYANGIAFGDTYTTGNDFGWIRQIETTANTSVLEMAVGDDGDGSEKMYFRSYNTSDQVVWESYFDSGNFVQTAKNQWLTPARLQIGRPGTTVYTDRSCIGTTDGNLHLDSYKGKGLYLNYYSSAGNIWFNGETYYINGGYYNGRSLYANYFVGCVNTITVAGDANTYYPVMISTTLNKEFPNIITVWKNLGSTTASYSGNHSNGTSSMIYRYDVRNAMWDGNGGYCTTLQARYMYARLVSDTTMLNNGVGNLCIWLRGGGTEYKISTSYAISSSDINVYYSSTNVGSSTYPVTVAPRTDIGNGGVYNSITIPCNVNYASSAGNADTVDGQHFNWNNNKNDHTYLWAASANGQAYLVHRASMSVNYASSAGSAASLSGGSVATWGTLTAANGYTNVCTWDTGATTGAFSLAGKGGQMSLQLDGFFYQDEGRYLVLDTNNYSSTLDGRYVNTAGDTMTGVLTMNTGTGFQMKYTTGGNDVWMYANGAPNYGIRYFEGNPDKMTLSASGNNNSTSLADLCINGNGEGTVTIRGNTIWHAGNDGSGSGLDADKVDGYHASSLWRSDGGVWNPTANISLGASANSQEWSFDITRNGYTGCYWHVWDSQLGTMLRVNADDGKVSAPYGFVGNLSGTASSVTVNNSDYDSTYRMVWHSGNNLYGTGGIYCNPSSDTLYATYYRSSGTIRVTSANSYGNFCEGLRLHAPDSTWATIIMGCTADTGTNTYAWSIHRKSDNNFCISRGSSDGANGLLINTSGNVGLGNITPYYKLTVNGTTYATKIIASGASGSSALSESWLQTNSLIYSEVDIATTSSSGGWGLTVRGLDEVESTSVSYTSNGGYRFVSRLNYDTSTGETGVYSSTYGVNSKGGYFYCYQGTGLYASGEDLRYARKKPNYAFHCAGGAHIENLKLGCTTAGSSSNIFIDGGLYAIGIDTSNSAGTSTLDSSAYYEDGQVVFIPKKGTGNRTFKAGSGTTFCCCWDGGSRSTSSFTTGSRSYIMIYYSTIWYVMRFT